MRLLFIGDLVGRAGRDAVRDHLPALRERLQPDAVIINAENSAHGFGHTPKICEELYGYGATCITSGNHIWDQREIIPYVDRDPNFVRPINFPPGTPGRGHTVLQIAGGRKLMVINVMGRLFMDALDDPFAVVGNLLAQTRLGKGGYDAIFVDIHAEASSEKQAFAHHFDGRVSVVVGTHTHVPTADARILPGGTGYQTDAGMSGDYDSVIGMRKDIAIAKFVRKMPTEKLMPAENIPTLCGVFIETDDATGKAIKIETIRSGPI
jgi:2',3'-cyclic-nucleotide 2'-phosphodiesterase